ncbi:hypothetical protein, partial [uncultured Allobaculum sp.]
KWTSFQLRNWTSFQLTKTIGNNQRKPVGSNLINKFHFLSPVLSLCTVKFIRSFINTESRSFEQPMYNHILANSAAEKFRVRQTRSLRTWIYRGKSAVTLSVEK